MLDEVMSALGVSSNAELARKLGVSRGLVWSWKKLGIPPKRRLEIAALIQKEGGRMPKGLLDPEARGKAAA